MTAQFTQIFQIVAVALQGINWELFPAKWKPFIMIGLSVVQAVQGAVAHYYNPDGTKAGSPPAQSAPQS
jgi:hypothetical protein